MNFLLFLLMLCTAYSEVIEPTASTESKDPLSSTFSQPIRPPSELTPSYSQPGVNPSYGQPSPSYGQPSDGYHGAYGNYADYAYAYQPYPVQKPEKESSVVKTLGTILPILRQAFHLILRIAGKVGLFLLGGAALLVVGGAFTAAVCSITPLCTFSFMGYGLSKEQVRSLITPDQITVATNLVTEAIDKYQKLQGVMDAKPF